MKTSKYSAVICLVGAKLLAKNDLERYQDCIIKFQRTIKNHAISDTNKCLYMFSGDTCYISSDDILDIFERVSDIRSSLFQQRVYINSIITNGDCGVNGNIYGNIRNFNTNDVNNLKRCYFGLNFHEESKHLRPEIEEMKTIGITVNLDKNEIFKKIEEQLITNVNITINNRKTMLYNDIILEEDSFELKTLNRTLEDLYYFNAFSKSISRYFIPLFVNLLISIDRNNYTDENKIITTLGSKSFIKNTEHIIGSEYVIFSIIRVINNKISKLKKENDSENEINEFINQKKILLAIIFRNKKIFQMLPNLPEFILPMEHRKEVIKIYAENKVLESKRNNTL